MRGYRARRKALPSPLKEGGVTVLPEPDTNPDRKSVTALLQAGVTPENVTPIRVLQGLLGEARRDRNAIAEHLAWHHESVKFPDVGTRLERLESENAQVRAELLLAQQRITLLEAAQVVSEAGAGEYTWGLRGHTLREELYGDNGR